MTSAISEVEALAALLVQAESDDRVDIVAAIDEASPAVRARVAEIQRRRINETEQREMN
jgi:hypothetical protein